MNKIIILTIIASFFFLSDLTAQKFSTIKCYSCEKIEDVNCTSCDKWFEKNYELFKGILVYQGGKVIPIYSGFKADVIGNTVKLEDWMGNKATIELNYSQFSTMDEMIAYLSNCLCGCKTLTEPPIEPDENCCCDGITTTSGTWQTASGVWKFN